ncbi:hypothetical protein K1T71_010352 [Dendrolimus kikuchii]|uniref:Uncharacterized protein n=1 Tax=Dendrolimus kikuchii TaxID=765133 RepID=A0ACC1CRI0_9NEOP|nr:hypothetical protein K1T71_010352 [Dendrolimus kikuchii]
MSESHYDESRNIRKKPKSLSNRSGLTFSVGRVHRILRHGHYAPRIGVGAAVYLTAALEYLTAEILELAANAASKHGRARISPRYILLAVKNDDELERMLRDAIIAKGGVLPRIPLKLLKKKTVNDNTKTNEETMSQEY